MCPVAQLIDQLVVPPYLQDEIDLEFLDAGKLITEPGAFWTNVWAKPNTTNIRDNKLYSSAIGRTIGDTTFSTTSALHTYVLDWQPTYIRWYIEGVLIDEMSGGAIPSAAMYGVFSLWTQTDQTNCLWFGGCLPAGSTATFSAKFTDFKRIRCYDPAAW